MNATDLTATPPGAGAQPPDAEDQAEPAEANENESMAPGEVCVPVSALAMPDEQDQMATPEAGDIVQLQVEAKVTRIEGENAYVQPMSVNGQEIKPSEQPAAEPTPEEQDQSDYADLQGMAQKQGAL